MRRLIPSKLVGKELLTIREVARALGRHHSAVFRWTSRGVRGHRLPSWLVGGRRYVTPNDLEKFLSDLNGQKVQPAAESRQEAVHRVDRELDQIFGTTQHTPKGRR